jgi:site-specific recombinase XerD
LAFLPTESEGVFMRERYIRSVMETITQPIGSKGLSDTEIIDLWLRRQRSSLTRSVYQRDMGRLTTWSDKTLAETDPLDLERFAEMLAGTGLAPISQGRTLAAIRSFFRFAERIGYCRNVAAGLELPRTDSPLSERIIPQEDVRRMIALEPDERNRVLLSVLYSAGLRVSEVCGLRWRNLQPRGDAGQILVHGKGGRTRAVLLPPGIWCQLAPLRATAGLDPPVFASRSGKPLERSRVCRIVREASQRAGITANVSTHWLRHAHASHALDRGAPIHLVQATLGHRSVATTSRYLHARPGESSAGYLAV